MNELLTGLAIPAVYVIVGWIKSTEKIDKKYMPIISGCLGIVIALAIAIAYGYDPLLSVLTMVVIGFGPVGVHEVKKGLMTAEE